MPDQAKHQQLLHCQTADGPARCRVAATLCCFRGFDASMLHQKVELMLLKASCFSVGCVWRSTWGPGLEGRMDGNCASVCAMQTSPSTYLWIIQKWLRILETLEQINVSRRVLKLTKITWIQRRSNIWDPVSLMFFLHDCEEVKLLR